jgi:hypothetical protein
MYGELEIPPKTQGDERASEMVRVWLAHSELHVALRLGVWADAGDTEVDERFAWGYLLADLARHIANGMNQSHGWDQIETLDEIREAFLENLGQDRKIEGEYPEE